MPPHPHKNMSSHIYPSITSHPICSFPYFTSTPIYYPYLFPHHPQIPYLGYLHIEPNRIHSYMFPNLLTPKVRPHYSRVMIKHRIIKRNQRSNLMKRRRRYSGRRREGGGVLHQNIKILLICEKIQCLLMNNRKSRDNTNKLVSYSPKKHRY